MRFSFTSVTGSFVFIIFVLLTISKATAAPNIDTQALRDAVTLDGVRSHQAALQAIADANGGTRRTGTAGYDASSDYVADQLEAAGYDVSIQLFTVPYFEELTPAEFQQISPVPTNYPYFTLDGFATMTYSGSGDVTGMIEAVDVTIPPSPIANFSNSGCEPADFSAFTPGNVALVQRGSCSFQTKAMNAEAAGASAVIIFNEGQPGRTVNFLGTLTEPSVTIPVIGASYAIGESLYTASLGTPVDVRIFVDAISENQVTQNIITELPGNHEGVVMVGAHLDSVAEGPGINDNGSGSAALLEIAIQLAALDIRPRTTLRFAWWGAEESGLAGSNHYLSNLNIGERTQIAAYINLEMLGSPNFVRFVHDGDGSDFPSSVPEGSANIEQLFNEYFAMQGLPVEPAPFSPAHSYSTFSGAGIAVGGLFGGSFVIKTDAQAAIFGGTAGDQFDPCYHLACDTFDNVSLEVLDQMSDAAAHVIQTLALTSVTVAKRHPRLPYCEDFGYDFNLKIDPITCSKSPNHWAKHPADWPLTSIEIGGVNYTKNQAIAVLKTKAKGDRTYALFGEALAAKLNVENCGPASGDINDAIALADSWLAANSPGSGVRSKDSEWDTGSPLFSILSEYNGGTFESGSYAIDGLGFVTINTEDGIYFDWTSDRATDMVIVKGGRDANVYRYDPESLGDFDLHAPINPKNDVPYGLSYVEFCFDWDVEINVHKFHDVDGDGEWDDDEPEIGVEVFVTPYGTLGGTSGWPYLFTRPLDDGALTNMFRTPGTHEHSAAGIYTAEELLFPNWEQTALYVNGAPTVPPVPFADIFYAGDADESHDILFGNIGLAEIKGRKFVDLDADGVRDDGEPGLDGVEITLTGTDINGNAVVLVTQTIAGGEFSFTGLVPGTYDVTETVPVGWMASTSATSGPRSVVTGEVLDLEWVFGNFEKGSIHPLKFLDVDADGVRDADEPGLAGFEFTLTGIDGMGNPVGPIQAISMQDDPATLEDEAGVVWFTDLKPGTYTVVETIPTGFMISTHDADDPSVTVTVISGQEYVAVAGLAGLPDPVLPPSRKFETLDGRLLFGNFETGSIHPLKFLDRDADGVRDADEPGLAGVEFTLTGIDGTGHPVGPIVQTSMGDNSGTPEDETGMVWFTGLKPGTYTVVENVPTGYMTSTHDADDPSVTVTIVSGQEYVALPGLAGLPDPLPPLSRKFETVDSRLIFGNFALGSIHGYKFNDLDGDGAEDADEPRLPGWVFDLHINGDIVQTTTTDENGEYGFVDLHPNTYYVTEQAQAGWVQTTPNPSPLTVESGQEYVASDGMADLPAGSGKVEVNIGSDLTFGNAQNGSIHGIKFEDLDGDGARDASEPGLEGWTIQLDTDGDGVPDLTTTTDANGEYAFTELALGIYHLSEQPQVGWLQTTPNPPPLKISSGQEYVAVDGQARLPDGSTKYETNLGQSLMFGNFQTGSIHGYKFNDLNNNGVHDVDEPRLAGWVFELSLEGQLVATQSTNDDGEFWFLGLGPGIYFVTEVTQAGWEQTTTSPGALELHSGEEYVVYIGQGMLLPDSTKYETVVFELAFGNYEIPNEPPTIISPATVSVSENQTSVIDVQATDDNDAEGAGLTFSLTGGADLAHLGIFANTGVIVFNGPPDFENPVDSNGNNDYEVQVTVTDSGPGGSLVDVQNLVITVTNVNEAPTAVAQAYNATGNVTINVLAAAGLVTGSSDPDGDTRTVDSVSGVTAGASVSENPDGSFTYTPPPGFEGLDSFDYTLIDDGVGTLTSNTATVTVTVNDVIWFIDNTAAAGDGRLNSPFNTLAAFEAANGNGGANDPAAGDNVFVYTGVGSYSGGVTLENNQQLIGQGTTDTSLAVALGITLAPDSDPLPPINDSTRPELGPTGTAVVLASGNTVRGLDVSVTGGSQGLVGIGFGTATIDEIAITTETGTALSLNNGNATATIDSITSTVAGANSAIALTNTGAGAITVNGGTISNKTVDAITLNDTDGPITLANMIIEDIGDMAGGFNTRSQDDAIHGAMVSGGLTLDGVTIRRISDMCVNGALFSNGVSPTTWNGLDILNSTIEDCNRWHVAGTGDTSGEGAIRIVGLTGTVDIDNSTIQRAGELMDLFTTPLVTDTLTMTVTNSNFFDAFKEFTSGGTVAIGKICIDVTVEGNSTANVTIGGAGTFPNNEFNNCGTASVRVSKDTTPAGNSDIDVVINNNSFIVTDQTSANGLFGNTPQGGVALRAGPGGITTFNSVVSNNTFGEAVGPDDRIGSTRYEVANADGVEGNVALIFESGASQARVNNNTFNGSINAPWFNRGDGNASAAVLYENNSYRGRDDYCCDSGFMFTVPGIPYRTRVRNNGNLDITFENDQFAVHDQFFFANTETIEFESRVVGGTMCVALDGTSSPDGYEFDELIGTINLYQGAVNNAATGPCTPGATNDCQNELADDGVRGGALDATLNPPFVDVDNGSISIIPSACTLPSGGIFNP